jgi:hypothetical protein
VKRLGVQVRARPGYLAPTEEEAYALGVPSRSAPMPAGTQRIARRPAITALRRGPSTGLKFVLAGQPQFRRTERLRIETPLPPEATGGAGRVLTSQGQAMPLVVNYSREETSGRVFGVAEVVLAPLAVGQYGLELSFDLNGQRQSVSYAFRIIP